MQCVLTIWLLCLASAVTACWLKLCQPEPIVVKRFGSKTAIVQPMQSSLNLLPNETIIVHCPTGIDVSSLRPVENLLSIVTAELECKQDGIFFKDRMLALGEEQICINCNGAVGQPLYESNVRLNGCGSDAMTLVVGLKIQGLPSVRHVGVCYNLGATRVQFITYLAYAPHNIMFDEQQKYDTELNGLPLDTHIGSFSNYFHFGSQAEFEELIKNQNQLGGRFDAKLFEYESLVQDVQVAEALSSHRNMLSVVWLRSLRSGNWKRWLDALRTVVGPDGGVASGNGQFEVHVGVSGVATMPVDHRFNATMPLILTHSTDSTKDLIVPEHIWAHVRVLKPTDAIAEFVVVAHNSPYVDILELSTFCVDICDEIPWLNNSLFGQMHLVPMYGVVHCCRVQQLHKLRDFPQTITMAARATTKATAEARARARAEAQSAAALKAAAEARARARAQAQEQAEEQEEEQAEHESY